MANIKSQKKRNITNAKRAEVIGETGVADVDWLTVGGVAVVAAIASVLTSLASAPFGPENTPSLVWDGDIVDG